MRVILILLSFLVITYSSMGEEKKTDVMLFGDVKSEISKEHLPFATILVKGTNIGTSADASGHFKLANLPVGKITIVAQSLGYRSKEVEITTERGKATELFFYLEEDVLNLEQVVVTGTRTDRFVKDVPVRTEVLTSKQIVAKNASNLYQALEGIPGVRVEQQCQFCNFAMVRMQGLGAEHTQTLINGQPIYSGLAGVYGLQQISTVDIDRIEVVKGAGSALYGSSAVAGAINIITREPSFEPQTTADIQFGNYNTNKYDISSSLRNEKGNIGLNVFAQKLTGDAIDQTGEGNSLADVKKKDGISDRVATNLNNLGFGLFIDHPFFEKDKLTVRGKSVIEKRQGGTMTDDYYKNPLTDGTESIFTDRYEADINYNVKINTRSEINFSVAYVNHNRDATNDSFLNDYLETHDGEVPDLRIMRPYLAKENSWTSTLTYGARLGNHALLTGIQGFHDRLNESGMYVVVDPESIYLGEPYQSESHKSARELGAFIQDEWKISDKLEVVPGVRIDLHHSEEEYLSDKQVFATAHFPKTSFNETSINPRMAVKYDLTRRISIRANAGTGFRAPYGFSEDLHLCSGSPRVWKSSELKPETATSYNLSADYYGKTVKISANLFHTDLKNKIGFTDADELVAALGYDYQWKNIDDATVQGMELSFLSNVTRNLNFGIDFTWNYGKYKEVRDDWADTPYAEISKYISRFPTTTGNIQLDYDIKNWDFVLTGNFQGPMYIDYYNTEINPVIGDQSKIKKTDPYMTFSARVSKQMNQLKFYGGIKNIFNYLQDEKHLDDAAFMYAPVYGTMFYAGVSFSIRH